MSYIKENFLLGNKTGYDLYFNYAKDMPIFDYHCHLSEKAILEDKPFSNIYELWLKEDHYKWRLMRNYGIDEDFITGKKTDKEKFIAFCKTLETAFGNPLYHWCQLELKYYFDCELDINEKNANSIWEHCEKYLREHNLTPSSIIKRSNVKCIFTTNEINDDLSIFRKIADKKYGFKVSPAFRADRILNIESKTFLDEILKLGQINSFSDLLNVIENRLREFIKCGCVASDIAVQKIYDISNESNADLVFKKRLNNKPLTIEEIESYKGFLTYKLLELYGKYQIRTELHIGAMRNNNSLMFEKLGPDTGFDSIAEDNSVSKLSLFMNALYSKDLLPPLIIFNLNPKLNKEIISLIGCFQDSSLKGKIQYGAPWWFLDNQNGIRNHLNDLCSLGHFSTYIGMLTDSRSFLSFSRHQYFRRLLCDFLGDLVERGEISNDETTLRKVIEDICYFNVLNYFKPL